MAEILDVELAKTCNIGPTRESAIPDGDAWACPASLYTASRFARPGLLLAGDAGSFIDPLSSFGVKKALSSGWLAGIVIHTSLVDAPMADTAVGFFDRREREVPELPPDIGRVLRIDADAPVGARDLFAFGSLAEEALVVHDGIDRIEVTPQTGLARVGGARFPKGYQVFEAIGFDDGADGEPRTADDLELGRVSVS